MRTGSPARRVVVSSSVAIALALASVLVPSPVSAASVIRVDTVTDAMSTDGHCSLREAVQAANAGSPVDTCAAHPGANIIDLPAGHFTIAIPGHDENFDATGDFDITSDLTIRGASAARTVIDGAGLERVFEVFGGAHVRLARMTITGGDSTDVGFKSNGGGIANFGYLTVDHARVIGNTAGPEGAGGGIFNTGALTLLHTTVADNSVVQGGGGGISSSGSAFLTDVKVIGNTAASLSNEASRDSAGQAAGIDSSGYLEIDRSLVAENHGNGEWTDGGITMQHGIVRATTIRDNTASDCGSGGIVMVRALMVRSTVSGNSGGECDGTGGVVAMDSRIVNSTISGNSSGDGHGEPGGSMRVGGILSDHSTIVSSTITDNVNALLTTDGGPGPAGLLVSGLPTSWVSGGATIVRGTIVAGNTDVNGAAWDCGGTVTSGGHDLFGATRGCTISSVPTDLLGVDPKLGPLADNGGPTLTQMPLVGSPAIDGWSVGGGSAAGCPRADQRGVRRPQDGDGNGHPFCDIGSVEVARPRR